jgi:hypothetical protein
MVWISATGISAVVVRPWVGSGVWLFGSREEVQDADQVAVAVAVAVNVAVGRPLPVLTGRFALEWKNRIEHVVFVAPFVQGTPMVSPHEAKSAPGAVSLRFSIVAVTCADGPEGTAAVTVTVVGAPSIRTHVSMFTTVAREPFRAGLHRIVPWGRSIAANGTWASAAGDTSGGAVGGTFWDAGTYTAGWDARYAATLFGGVPWGGVVLDLVRRSDRDQEDHRAMVSETGLRSSRKDIAGWPWISLPCSTCLPH